MKMFFFLQIYPLSGPKKGGTELTIEGMNLGKAYEDIVNFVDVAMISCKPIRKKYQPPSRLVVYYIISTILPYFGIHTDKYEFVQNTHSFLALNNFF